MLAEGVSPYVSAASCDVVRLRRRNRASSDLLCTEATSALFGQSRHRNLHRIGTKPPPVGRARLIFSTDRRIVPEK